ncbi:hypothetical protein BDZ45DRAFT_798137 [Acephala macrosclerotiorum]|nr:hypothetical protein BDZ45DRAFT_798137 [Acephala macrosclerotiorum]
MALVEAPKQVTNHYYTCSSQGGHHFTKGDEITKASLSQSLEKFGRTVLESMKYVVTQNNSLNLQSMTAMTHLFKESMSMMDELYQRVQQAATPALLAAFNTLPHNQNPPKDSVESDTAEKSTIPETIVVLDFAVRSSNLERTKLVQRHLEILGHLPE